MNTAEVAHRGPLAPALEPGHRQERAGARDAVEASNAVGTDLAPLDPPEPITSLSIVIPVFNEEGNLDELHRRLSAVLSGIALPYEIVLVDDGSTDGTWDMIRVLATRDHAVVGFRHRRNFGKARALALGFAEARGAVVVTMDGDLQDDPDELPRFLELLAEGYDVVSGWKQRRRDPLGKTLPSRIFNFAVRRVSGVPLHDFNCGYKAYRIEVVRTLRLYGELHRFTPVLAHAEGFTIGELPVHHHARRWGTSKYGWSRLVKGFLDLVTVKFLTEYRQRPMHLLGLPGIVAMGLGVLTGLWLVIERFLTGAPIGTRPLLSLAVLLVVIGAQFFGLGLLGELLTHGFFPGGGTQRPGPVSAIRDSVNRSDGNPREA
ncbi:MAG: glycosyltransferase family 2 protein [Chloroflexia bacterium]|nr:glycosyltransferase family 2 protein [Chloroflexia bacterium]MDQ3412707.1 glycosyltransferase family 2 protein [Chloroflexota bacterium]